MGYEKSVDLLRTKCLSLLLSFYVHSKIPSKTDFWCFVVWGGDPNSGNTYIELRASAGKDGFGGLWG